MKTARYNDAQIMGILKQAEGGVPVTELCREVVVAIIWQFELNAFRLAFVRWPVRVEPTRLGQGANAAWWRYGDAQGSHDLPSAKGARERL